MRNKLLDYFADFAGLSAEEARAIEDSMVVKTYPKGTILLREGQISNECYFVLQGCVRQYYLIDGEEKTDQFFTEEQWIVSMTSFTEKVPAAHYWSCCEETTLVVANEERENDLYTRFPRFETISRNVMGKMLADQQAQMASYLTDSPEQRYLKLLESRPDLFQRIPQYQLASYIGVKPESLSRIRKRIVSRNTD